MKMRHNRFLAMMAGLVWLAAGVASYAQTVRETTHAELPAFNTISLGGDFKLEIRYGKQYHARMGVEELMADYVRFEVADSTLRVDLDERRVPAEIRRLYRRKDAEAPVFRIVVTMPETLRALHLADRAELLAADELVASVSGLEIRARDNARLAAFRIEVPQVSIELERRAEAGLSVRCDSLHVRLGGNASLELEQEARIVEAEMAGSSALVLSGETQRLRLQAKGASKAILNGTAPLAEYVLSGSANVNSVNLLTEVTRSEQSGLTTLTEASSRELYVDLGTGSTLVFLNAPTVHVLGIKNATLIPYDRK